MANKSEERKQRAFLQAAKNTARVKGIAAKLRNRNPKRRRLTKTETDALVDRVFHLRYVQRQQSIDSIARTIEKGYTRTRKLLELATQKAIERNKTNFDSDLQTAKLEIEGGYQSRIKLLLADYSKIQKEIDRDSLIQKRLLLEAINAEEGAYLDKMVKLGAIRAPDINANFNTSDVVITIPDNGRGDADKT